ncbi:hypothetical protein VOLCADRAFT_103118 [Volvox carteri f. nagariensis]|uniref:Uncharacterized protein n=1 Tax=Volvox carteri f. nagariensis TaxID=3068 RepID=D8TKR2_VOLCA|nr:uncharacterized protein VOLCADRAFT_103118 [Volvox carteri f. nagariensis]EFJ51931.1 hypothetical protein VOLCADRAFT_103118 [Volvox carteri f. nagariensis]|eukprot:XP_002946705.1 hypothetical protein VOLCADRAFT_103118 [Volvox carteri f. nagariensis]
MYFYFELSAAIVENLHLVNIESKGVIKRSRKRKLPQPIPHTLTRRGGTFEELTANEVDDVTALPLLEVLVHLEAAAPGAPGSQQMTLATSDATALGYTPGRRRPHRAESRPGRDHEWRNLSYGCSSPIQTRCLYKAREAVPDGGGDGEDGSTFGRTDVENAVTAAGGTGAVGPTAPPGVSAVAAATAAEGICCSSFAIARALDVRGQAVYGVAGCTVPYRASFGGPYPPPELAPPCAVARGEKPQHTGTGYMGHPAEPLT